MSISMPTAEQMAILASYTALESDLLEVRVDGEMTVMPTDLPLQLLKPGEQEELDKMVTIACTLVYYEGYEVAPLEELQEAVLRAWGEGILDD